jgi:hypothetical protein
MAPYPFIPMDPCDGGTNYVYSGTTTFSWGEYLSTQWGQNEPYNTYTPSHYPTGCVAVATAQIMRFHTRPTSFNWAIMPNSATSATAGALEIARLMKDIGDKVNMKYSASGSSATSSKARKALVDKYGYNKEAKLDNYNYDKVVTELKTKNRPIYIDGQAKKIDHKIWFIKWSTYEDGHAYVLDGYREIKDVYLNTCNNATITVNPVKFLHMNFGWGVRQFDAWFTNNIIDVPAHNGTDRYYIDWDNTASLDFPNFQFNKDCIYNIHP